MADCGIATAIQALGHTALLASTLAVGCTALNPAFGDDATASGGAENSGNEAVSVDSSAGEASKGSVSTSSESESDAASEASATSGSTSASSVGGTLDAGVWTTDTGTVSTGIGDTGESTGPAEPCFFEGMAAVEPRVCYDFSGASPGEDRMGFSDLAGVLGTRTDVSGAWMHGIECSSTGCDATAAAPPLAAGFTLEVWGRLTDLSLVAPGQRHDVVVISGATDTAGVDVYADQTGSLHWRTFFLNHALTLATTNTGDFFCIGLRWAPGSVPRATAWDSTSVVRPDGGMQGASVSAELANPSLQLGAAALPAPVEVIGVRLWDDPSVPYCELLPPP